MRRPHHPPRTLSLLLLLGVALGETVVSAGPAQAQGPILPPIEIIDPGLLMPPRDLQVDELSVSVSPALGAVLPGQSVDLNVHVAASTDFLLGWPRPEFDARISLVVRQWCGWFSWCEVARVPLDPPIHFSPAEVRMRGLFELQAKDAVISLGGEPFWQAVGAWREGFLTSMNFEVFLDEGDLVGEGGTVELEDTNNRQLVIAPALPLPLTGRLDYGPAVTALDSVSAVAGPSGACPAGTWELLPGTAGTWDPGASWDDVAWEVNSTFGNFLCASAGFNADSGRYDLTATDAQVGYDIATGTLGGQDLRLFFFFDETGALPGLATGPLPPWHSLHGDDGAKPLPRGIGALLFNAFVPASGLGNFDSLAMTSTIPLWLQARDLPFSFYLDVYQLDASGIQLGWSMVHYQRDLPYSLFDERRVSWKGLAVGSSPDRTGAFVAKGTLC